MKVASSLFVALGLAGAVSLSAREAISLPLVFQPDQELADLFGYEPEYTANVPTFDSKGRPYIRSRGTNIDETSFIHTVRDGKWVEIPILPALREAWPDFRRTVAAGGTTEVRVIFDREDRFYTVLRIQLEDRSSKTVMLVSSDYGKTLQAVELPPGSVPAEHVSGHNGLDGPPFLMIAERLEAELAGRWARLNRLKVAQPFWKDERVVVPEPVEVSRKLVGLGQHSGGSSFAVTRDGKTHFVWAEITEDENATGTPSFIATYDRETGEVSTPRLLVNAPPLNNSHNMPGICLDSEGFLHVVTGSHYGEIFMYTRSLEPNDPASGWTEPSPVWATGWTAASGNEAGGQTYVALVCAPDDTLHLVFRHWQMKSGKYPHLAEGEGTYFGALAYQRKPKDGPWSEPKTLVVPERDIYAIYYHKLSVGPAGQLFLSASYMDRVLLERSETERFLRRMTLTSPDGGETWRFAETADFAAPSG